ncbi:MAG TPA: flagellar basal body P-ring protein FlgI [Caldithrix sp.]|nr:flagellar basal body P-ring protein FlgI [Caldithrix sp.]
MKSKQRFWLIFLLICLPYFLFAKVRIKELARIQGISKIPLTGYGLVIGLNGTGDSKRAAFTTQSVVNMLKRFGINVPENQLRLRNVAAVMVTTEAPTFLSAGDRLDVTISSLGDAKSLEGGVLLMTPLVDQNGELYGMAQGPVAVGGFSVQTTGGGGVRQNHTLVGRIPGGAVLQKDMGKNFHFPDTLYFSLNETNFTTAQRMVDAINQQFNDSLAFHKNPRTIGVKIPRAYLVTGQQSKFIAELEQIEIEPDVKAKVVINERTGTVVVGGNVRLLPAAIAHGNLSVEIQSQPIISQPAPFSQGQTVVLPNTQATVYTEPGKIATITQTATVQEVAQALNTLGLTPRDIIAVLQALKEAGSLQAELVIM